MLPMPKAYKVVAGASEGETFLTAFDKALLQAGVGNINIIKVTSILPPEAEYTPDLVIPPGSIVPTAFASILSDEPGKTISACVGVGISEKNSYGVIMEYSGYLTKEEVENEIRRMVGEAFQTRGLELRELKLASSQHKVEKIGCALAAVPLWY